MFLVVPLILGSIVGVQVGQKIGQFLDSNELKSLFAMLLITVAIAIAYDSFFRNKTEFNGSKVSTPELNSFAEFIVRMSIDVPFLYGAFAIILAVTLGALMAWIRKIVHDLRYKKPKNIHKSKPTKFSRCPPGNLKGLPSTEPASLPNATKDPVKVTAPIKIPRRISTFKIDISTIVFLNKLKANPVKSASASATPEVFNAVTVDNSTSAFRQIKTAASPTNECNAATNWGISVISTRLATA